jgi:transcriptional regulator with XRE-family HTH domain
MKKKKTSIFSQMMENEKFKKKFDEEKQIFEIEYQLAQIMEQNGITQKNLAEKLGIDKSVVSKDLAGSLKKAGMKKLQAIAEALDCEFVPLFVPKNKKKKIEKQVHNIMVGAKRA